MDGAGRSWIVLLLVLTPNFSDAWREERREARESREMRRPAVHHHSKRHMMVSEPEPRKRSERTTPKPVRDVRKKPSGHLSPLLEDDIENDEVVSVAIGPPPQRPKFEKHRRVTVKQSIPKPQPPNSTAVDLVKQILSQLGREFLSKDLNENFVFGQYVGNAMRNLTNDLRLRMQHEVLDLIMKYQKLNLNGTKKDEKTEYPVESHTLSKIGKIEKIEKIEKKFQNTNETDESWPDFTNLAKLVG